MLNSFIKNIWKKDVGPRCLLDAQEVTAPSGGAMLGFREACSRKLPFSLEAECPLVSCQSRRRGWMKRGALQLLPPGAVRALPLFSCTNERMSRGILALTFHFHSMPPPLGGKVKKLLHFYDFYSFDYKKRKVLRASFKSTEYLKGGVFCGISELYTLDAVRSTLKENISLHQVSLFASLQME